MIKTVAEFLALVDSDDRSDYGRLRNEEAPQHVWETLLEKSPLANEWIANNKKSPAEILHKLATIDERPLIRSELARVRRITEQTQLMLASDKDYSVRYALVYNAKLTVRVLEILAKDLENDIAEKARERLVY